jgi:hypothetical protein
MNGYIVAEIEYDIVGYDEDYTPTWEPNKIIHEWVFPSEEEAIEYAKEHLYPRYEIIQVKQWEGK